MRFTIFLLVISVLFSCNVEQSEPLQEGVWRAELKLTDAEVLPFNFEVTSPNALKIFNADEVIMVTDIQYSNDSVLFKAPVFDGYIKAVMKKKKIEGAFIKEGLDRIVPFSAVHGISNRFEVADTAVNSNVSGIWETVFSPDNDEDKYIAKGIFEQEGQRVTGTFRTTTGDYRYLEGVVEHNIMKLSTFDGAHAFLFTAEVNDSTMTGTFYSGNHWEEPFVAKRNNNYELPDANSLTYLKEGYDSFAFNFPDAEGKMLSLEDPRFKNKVVVVQVMGTWCPNCLDESQFYSEFYDNNAEKDIEFVALAFEYAKTEVKAFDRIKRLKDDVGIQYPILLAQYGSSSKVEAQEKLPMLNHVLSYPTSIFIDKEGKVRKIHTGFNGPATGTKYEDFKLEFSTFINELLSE